jgi:predicted DNA-binding protein with PD1-like motif
MLIDVAFCHVHVSVAIPPVTILTGETEMEHVGAGMVVMTVAVFVVLPAGFVHVSEYTTPPAGAPPGDVP